MPYCNAERRTWEAGFMIVPNARKSIMLIIRVTTVIVPGAAEIKPDNG